ncbi:MAG: hypothetical protein WAV09_03375 [Minisyncoccia bacterium]
MTIIRAGFPNFPRLVLAKSPMTPPGDPKVGGAPVIFSAQATLKVGKSAVLNAQTLQSGFRTGYFIDEIRISMTTEPMIAGLGGNGDNCTGLAGVVRIKFQTGAYVFSADAVPVGLLAPYFGNDYGRHLAGTVGADPTNRSYSTVRWALPKPLYMPAGDVVLANVELATNSLLTTMFGAEDAVKVTVTYVGRIIPQGFGAKVRNVPWLAWWSKDHSTAYADAQTRLRNPFAIPVHVQRFTQRTYRGYYDAIAPEDTYWKEVSSIGQLYNTNDGYETIKIADSRGYAITNKFVPVGDVFDVSRHAWTFGRELTPREQFDMQMTSQGTLVANTSLTTNVGVVGYRSEAP